MSKQQLRKAAEILRALGEPYRIAIVEFLAKGGAANVGEIAAACVAGNMPNASHHLEVLRHAGVVVSEKDGRFRNYSLNPEVWTPSKGVHYGVLDAGWQVVLVKSS